MFILESSFWNPWLGGATYRAMIRGRGHSMREAAHKTTCGVDNHPGSTGTLYWETWSCQLERGGGVFSTALRHDEVNRREPDHFGLIFCYCYCCTSQSSASSFVFVPATHLYFWHRWTCADDVLLFVPNQRHSVKPSKYCYSAHALNNPINPNAFQTSPTGWLCPCQAQFKGYSELNTHLCESEILQLQQMASIRCSCKW